MPDLDETALRGWLVANVAGLPDAPMELEALSGGHSNVTYSVTIGDQELVVRMPPATAFLPTANDVGREHRFYAALQDTAVPTPRVLGLCADAAVVGAPFYVMERLHGVVPHDPSVLEGLSADGGRAHSEQLVDVLAEIHATDRHAVGLGEEGRPDGYLERQVARWTDQWHRATDHDDATIDELARRLGQAIPTSPPATIVHGDYRLGNLMVDAATRAQVVGVLDWEMATIGDPLADVGYTLLYWGTAGRPAIHPSQGCADLPGFLTADELIDRYARTTGLTVDHVPFYIVLAAFKLTIIGAGNLARMRRAGRIDAATGDVDRAGIPLAEWALELWGTS
jgi:aminoglycoside phosphotransferase (APT) family kinase protein